MKLIDSHCHLVDEKLVGDVEGIIERAKSAGVERIITMGGGRKDWPRLIEMADKYPDVYIALGWHPEDITKEEDLGDLAELIPKTKKCMAIGEVGLDFYYDKEKKTKDLQLVMMRKQIELAIELNKPLVIHSRWAEEEMEELMDEYGTRFKAQFHCFGESEKFLTRVLNDGHMVSFGGNITFKSAGNLREMIKTVPSNKLMLETDAPYLSPEPVRGRLNEPANLIHTAQFIAKELKIEVEELAKITYNNTVCFFLL